MTRQDRRGTGGRGGRPPRSRTRMLAGLCGAAVCLPALAACTSAGTTAASPADSSPADGSSPPNVTFTPSPYAEPLLRCTSDLWLGAGQRSICQSGDVEGRFTYFGQGPGERLPLIITRTGRAEIKIIVDYVEGDSPGVGIVYIDTTPNQAAS